MIELQGKYAEAKIFTNIVDNESISQVIELLNQPYISGSRVRMMPDIHAGAGCTIGTTMTISDKICPNLVGVDIGCGMYAVNLGQVDIDMEQMDAAAHFIPSGMNVWEGRKEHFDLLELRCYRELKDSKRLERSLGTLGGGNHFIEIDQSTDGIKFLVIHSGSRNLGKQVAEYYQRLAIDLNKGKEEYFAKRDALIAEYKATGRRTEIQAALKELRWNAHETMLPEGLCFVYGQYMEDYLHDVKICQRFACRSRELMAEIILQRLGLEAVEAFHTIHNYIDTDEMILRKGAIAAHKGEKVLIPINMRDGSLICTGKGNEDWNFSAPHGAGRLMSRREAKETFTVSEFKEQMNGIYTTSIGQGTLDECPMAYKSMNDIVNNISPTVSIDSIIKPIYNFKAGNNE